MGFFKNIFGASEPKEKKVLPWQELTEISQLDEIAKRSQTKTQVIFKHSTRCGISSMVLNQFVDAYDLELNFDLYYLDLLSYRDVSNEVGYRFQVMHQSPQLLIIKNGNTVWHASHGAINNIQLEQFE
ncbi:bacillithiol system redox-active protein YtxJ [Psychroserpens sp. XS_ASV72]|uniref:bacillithiol system redox-active protein YtxJ n=1 Tax=Psychroserpens sp. XS_ASV72 TaxID=3241293 RepID=UPI0035179754